jgi:DNA-binding NarL/FixJ family response regulator
MIPVRVMVADDHEIIRSGIRTLLASTQEAEIIGETVNGQETVSQALALQPDVILMDIQMPDMNGIEATRRIHNASPQIGIIIVTIFEDDDTVFSAMRAGARGYILKGTDQVELLRAIQAAASGEALFSPGIANRMIGYFSRLEKSADQPVFPELTEREREILALIASGMNNTQIAERLVLSQKTIRNHISNIFSKLQVADRAEAIVRAHKAGLGNKIS